MAAVTPGIAGLLRPPDERAFLVKGERVLYREPHHWASLVEPGVETISVLMLMAPLWGRTPPALTFIVSLMFVVAAFVVYRIVQRRDWGWNEALAGTIGLLFLVNLRLGIESVLLLAATVTIARMVLVMLRWAFFDQRYVTDRRVIETSGLLRSAVSSTSVQSLSDIVLYRSWLGGILDYGELRLESPGQDQAITLMRHLVDPDRFYTAVVRGATPSPTM